MKYFSLNLAKQMHSGFNISTAVEKHLCDFDLIVTSLGPSSQYKDHFTWYRETHDEDDMILALWYKSLNL